jgi:hypothetical protein
MTVEDRLVIGTLIAPLLIQTVASFVADVPAIRLGWQPRSAIGRLTRRYLRWVYAIRYERRASHQFGLILASPFLALLLFGLVWTIFA